MTLFKCQYIKRRALSKGYFKTARGYVIYWGGGMREGM